MVKISGWGARGAKQRHPLAQPELAPTPEDVSGVPGRAPDASSGDGDEGLVTPARPLTDITRRYLEENPMPRPLDWQYAGGDPDEDDVLLREVIELARNDLPPLTEEDWERYGHSRPDQ